MSGAPGSGGRWLGHLPKQPGLGIFHSLEEALWQLFMPWWVLERHGSFSCSEECLGPTPVAGSILSTLRTGSGHP